MTPRLAAAIIGSIQVLVLAATFYAWRFSYFWLDDFNNLFWVQQQSLSQMLWYNADPFTTFFRPFGMLFYWVFLRLFDLNPVPYHLFAWALHTANVVLLFALLSRIVGSRYAAAAGALLFGLRANFTDIYWSFGTIFELLACFLVLTGLLIHSGGWSPRRFIIVAVLYLLAVKSKEMAITLPAVLLLYDVCFRPHQLNRMAAIFYSGLAALGGGYGYTRFAGMRGGLPTDVYYMDFSILTFGRGYGWYFNHLYGLNERWGFWIIVSVLALALFLYRREKRGLFFLGYAFMTLLPVIFLINHRYEFFWYVPFLGIAGLAAVLVETLESRLKQRMPARTLAAAGVIVFALLAVAHYAREIQVSAPVREYERSLAEEYSAFAGMVRSLPEPESESTLTFASVPRHFTPDVVTSAVQVILRRTDIRAEVVR